MRTAEAHVNYFYTKDVVQRISDKYNMDAMTAL